MAVELIRSNQLRSELIILLHMKIKMKEEGGGVGWGGGGVVDELIGSDN